MKYIKGRVYVAINAPGIFIFRCTQDHNQHSHIPCGQFISQGRRFERKNGDKTHNWGKSRLATPEEIKWLEACEKAGKFVEPSEINKEANYEIY